MEHLLQARSLSDNTGSASSLQQLCTWYINCLQNHEVCKRQSSSTVYHPTWLLNISCVGEQITVRLVNSADLEDKNPYMTLSHCWGSVTRIRHTALTKAKLESGLAVGDLPKTFQDTVELHKPSTVGISGSIHYALPRTTGKTGRWKLLRWTRYTVTRC